MTDNHRQGTTGDEDVLEDSQDEAQLHYRAVARRKDDRKGGRGAVVAPATGPQSGAAPTTTPAGTPYAPSSQGLDASTAVSAAALGASAAAAGTPSRAVRFDDDQLTASAHVAPSHDPWGAYDNPENVPGLELGDDEDEPGSSEFGGMALRGSGTRGRKEGSGGSAPFVPLGAGSGGAATTLPGATVGGIGASSGLAAQQPALAVQAALSAAQQGSVPLNLVQGLGAARASGAMMSPPATGVLAAGAGGGPGIDPSALDETIRRLGIDSDQPFVMGPDGNLYPNPYYVAPAGGAPARPSAIDPADLNGDGVVTEWERSRWLSGQERTGGSTTTGGVPAGGWGGGMDGSASGGGSVSSPYGSGAGWPSGGDAGSGRGWSSGQGGQTGGGGGGYSAPAAGGGSAGGYSSGGYSSGGHSPGGHAPSGYSGSGGAASGADYSVRTDELRGESQEWEQIADRQGQLANDVESLPDPAPTFGVLSAMVPPYSAVQDASAESALEAGAESQYTAGGLDENAASYDANEEAGSAIAGRMND